MATQAYKDLIEMFTTKARITQIIYTLIDSMINYVEDPIAHIMIKFLKEKISIVFINEGISLFKSDPTIILPFKQMTHKEIEILKTLLVESTNANEVFMSEQRGGSCSVTVALPAHELIAVRHSLLLSAIRDLLQPLNTKFKIDVVNVVLQRLICSAKISPAEIRAIQS